MTERQLSKAIVALAEMLGWRVFTVSNTKAAALRSHSGVGFPYLLMVRNGQLIAAELKVKGRKATSAQQEWLAALSLAECVHAVIWRECDWHNGSVERALRHMGRWTAAEEQAMWAGALAP